MEYNDCLSGACPTCGAKDLQLRKYIGPRSTCYVVACTQCYDTICAAPLRSTVMENLQSIIESGKPALIS